VKINNLDTCCEQVGRRRKYDGRKLIFLTSASDALGWSVHVLAALLPGKWLPLDIE
jgi:hypothetical protein